MRNRVLLYANNKGADQPAHTRSLVSAFVIRCLDSIMPLVSVPTISSLYQASVAVQSALSLTWSQTPKTGFLMTRLILLVHVILAHRNEGYFFSVKSIFCIPDKQISGLYMG